MKPLKFLLSSFLRSFASDSKLTLIFLKELWPQLVGANVARNTRPISLEDTTLTLGVVDGTWEKQLQGLQDQILRSINDHWQMALVDRIRLRVGPVSSGSGRNEAQWSG